MDKKDNKELTTGFNFADFAAITAPPNTSNGFDLTVLLTIFAMFAGNNNSDTTKLKEDVAELKGKISIIEKLL